MDGEHRARGREREREARKDQHILEHAALEHDQHHRADEQHGSARRGGDSAQHLGAPTPTTPPTRRAQRTRAPSGHAGISVRRRSPPTRQTPPAEQATRSQPTADSPRHRSARSHRTRQRRGGRRFRGRTTHGAIAATARVRDAGHLGHPAGHRAGHPGHPAGHRVDHPDRRAGPRAVREPCRAGRVDLLCLRTVPSSCSFRSGLAVRLDRGDERLGRDSAVAQKLAS